MRKKVKITFNKDYMTVNDMKFCVSELERILKMYKHDTKSDQEMDDMIEDIGGRVYASLKYIEVED